MIVYIPIDQLVVGAWVNLEIEVIQLWDSDVDTIRQIGIVGDDTGIVKFVSWEKSNLPLLQLEAAYSITKVVVSEFNGKLQAALTKKSVITRKGAEQMEQTEIPTV